MVDSEKCLRLRYSAEGMMLTSSSTNLRVRGKGRLVDRVTRTFGAVPERKYFANSSVFSSPSTSSSSEQRLCHRQLACHQWSQALVLEGLLPPAAFF